MDAGITYLLDLQMRVRDAAKKGFWTGFLFGIGLTSGSFLFWDWIATRK